MSGPIDRLRTPDGRWRLWPGAAGLALLVLIGLSTSPGLSRYQLSIATTLLIYLALAQSWNLLAGYGGLVSLGVSAFVGSGAYGVALLTIHTSVGVPAALGAALLIGAALAAVLSVPLLRLRGDYFSIGTLAAALALQAWVFNWTFAGGSVGLTMPIDRTPDLLATYRLACLIAGAVMLVAFLVGLSTFGMRLRAVRDAESAATGLGVSASTHRLVAFVLCGALSGLAGGLVAFQQTTFEPSGMLGLSWSINALLMTIVGGIGTIVGPVIGTVIVYYVLTRLLAGYDAASVVIEGLLLVVIVRFAPQGVWPTLLSIIRRILPKARTQP